MIVFALCSVMLLLACPPIQNYHINHLGVALPGTPLGSSQCSPDAQLDLRGEERFAAGRKKDRAVEFAYSGGFRLLRIKWCDRHLGDMTRSDHAHRFGVKRHLHRMYTLPAYQHLFVFLCFILHSCCINVSTVGWT